MKKIFILLIVFCLSSCVQKTYKRTVVFQLDVSKEKNVKTVGIRGEGKPLSWDQDLPMKEIVKDSLYELTVTTKTGYKSFEMKFTVNGQFEMENQPNREIVFTGNKTKINALFNKK